MKRDAFHSNPVYVEFSLIKQNVFSCLWGFVPPGTDQFPT